VPVPVADAAAVPVPVADAAPVATPDADQTPDTDTGEALRAQVNTHLAKSDSRLSRCYSESTKALPEDQALSGEVDISFEVMPTGGTRNVAVVRNTTGSNHLGDCLGAVVGDWTFEPFTGDAVTFLRTFRFAGHT
jgi:hypothetical protein